MSDIIAPNYQEIILIYCTVIIMKLDDFKRSRLTCLIVSKQIHVSLVIFVTLLRRVQPLYHILKCVSFIDD